MFPFQKQVSHGRVFPKAGFLNRISGALTAMAILVLTGLVCSHPQRDNPADPRSPLFRELDQQKPEIFFSLEAGKVFGAGEFPVQGVARDNKSVFKIELALDGGPFSEASGRENWTWVLVTSDLENGSHRLKARATDRAGNRRSTTIQIEIDKTRPAAVLGNLPPALTQSRDLDVTVSGQDIVAYKFNIDNTYFSDPRDVAEPLSVSGLFLDGPHNLKVIGQNDRGTWQDEEDATEYTWTVDTTPPVVTVTAGTPTPENPTLYEFTVSGDGAQEYYYSVDGGPFQGPFSVDDPIILDATVVNDINSLRVLGVDGAGNQQSEEEASQLVPLPPIIISARTMDMDGNGFIDHCQLVFSQPVNDASFPGYLTSGDPTNRLHSVTTNWEIAGYMGIRLDTRDAAPPDGPGDTSTNDNILYLAFSEQTVAYDTSSAPDVTAPTPGLQSTAGIGLAEVGTTDVTEEDGAAPVIALLNARVGNSTLPVHFYEPVYGSVNGSGAISSGAFSWINNVAGGATSINGFSGAAGASDGSDGLLELLLDAGPLFGDGDPTLPGDGLEILPGFVYDGAGNAITQTKYLRFGAQKLSLSTFHACALSAAGQVRCWGYGTAGRLGYENTSTVGGSPGTMPPPDVEVLSTSEISAGSRVLDIVTGANQSCALINGGNWRCWGNNSTGQLAVGHTNNVGDAGGTMPPENSQLLSVAEISSGLTITKMVIASNTFCLLLSNGRVRCGGNNGYGELGLNDETDRGGDPADLPLSENAILLTSQEEDDGVYIEDLAGGRYHYCALLSTGAVRCWGGNHSATSDYGILGYGVSTSFSHVGDDPGEMPPPDVELLSAGELSAGIRVDQIAVGSYHNCVLLSNNEVRCWGYNNQGQLGIGSTNLIGGDPADMPPANTTVLSPAERTGGLTVSGLALGGANSCVQISNGAWRCWGYNGNGALAEGNGESRGDDPGEMPPPDLSIFSAGDLSQGLAIEGFHPGGRACALLNNGEVRCWGTNIYGQLGYEHADNLGDDPGEIPTPAVDLGWP